jgi:murein L,D-transpeptidase YafK
LPAKQAALRKPANAQHSSARHKSFSVRGRLFYVCRAVAIPIHIPRIGGQLTFIRRPFDAKCKENVNGAVLMLRCVGRPEFGQAWLLGLAALAAPLLMAASEGPQTPAPRAPATHAAAATSLAPKHLKPIAADTAARITQTGLGQRAPLHIRVFKEESELEVWKQRSDGTYAHIKTYPICNFSGGLGPKQRYADYQSPEGFYTVEPRHMRPNSNYHLAFDVNYPNALDRSLGRTGNLIMVHGACKSVGCFAMTNTLIEDIYALAREAFAGGQTGIPVHSFPFRMTPDAMAQHAAHPHAASWQPLQQAYWSFEATRRLPNIAMCDKRYVVNPVWFGVTPKLSDPTTACPAHIEASVPPPVDEAAHAAEQPRAVASGPKTRTVDNLVNWGAIRARMAVLAAENRRVKREKFQQVLAAREGAEAGSSQRSYLGGQ